METLSSPVVAVVGNGPNLEIKQLDMLHEARIYSVGMNRIFRAYPDTEWRPDLVVMSDFMRNSPAELSKDLERHLSEGDYPVLIRGDMGRYLSHRLTGDPRVSAFLDCSHSIAGPDNWHPRAKNSHLNEIEGCGFSTDEWHLPSYCKAGGSMPVALQHAAMMSGVSKIVLVGVGGTYYAEEHRNHLWPDYLPPTSDRTPEQAKVDTLNLYWMHEVASRESKKLDIEIWNCSPGSEIRSHKMGDLAEEIMYSQLYEPPATEGPLAHELGSEEAKEGEFPPLP